MGSQCVFYKYKIPTEIRNSIFIQAAYNNFEEAYRYDNGVVGWSSETPTRAQELDYPPTKYDVSYPRNGDIPTLDSLAGVSSNCLRDP